ncbi:MAG: hypothetical protein IPJ74_13480 [Saprospiraceae bacterium]|nr:hypothetical protein [Saprospiraceae bacterium]
MKIRVLFIIIIGLCAQHLIAQIEFTDNFRHLIENAGIDFYEPTEGSYKEVKLQKHTFQPCDFGIRSRREKLEIRYLVAPYSEHNIAFKAPHVECFRMVSNLATNEEDAAITSLIISEDELKENFNADWGKIYFSNPKIASAIAPIAKCWLFIPKAKAWLWYSSCSTSLPEIWTIGLWRCDSRMRLIIDAVF